MSSADSPKPITSEFLIVGEGGGDASFVENLCQVRGVPGFQVEDARGESNFVERVKGMKSRKGFDRLKGILVVSDNDDGPEQSFKKIRNYLKDAKVPFPDAPLKAARREQNGLAVVVMMIPFEDGIAHKGCLETLLLKSIEGHEAVRACIDAYSTCLGAGRTRNQEDKLQMRCFVTAKYPEDPNLSLSHALSPSKGIIDLGHKCFDEIYAFLREFPKICEPRRNV